MNVDRRSPACRVAIAREAPHSTPRHGTLTIPAESIKKPDCTLQQQLDGKDNYVRRHCTRHCSRHWRTCRKHFPEVAAKPPHVTADGPARGCFSNSHGRMLHCCPPSVPKREREMKRPVLGRSARVPPKQREDGTPAPKGPAAFGRVRTARMAFVFRARDRDTNRYATQNGALAKGPGENADALQIVNRM